MLEHKDFTLEIKNLKDGSFQGYASVFGVEDEGGDTVVKGAFTSSIADKRARGRKVPMLWSHNRDEPIGFYSEMKEDDYGLFVEGQFSMDVMRAKEVHALMKDGAVDGLSIGFRTKRSEYDNDTGKRKLIELQLFEVSVCCFPMLDIARAQDVKSFDFNPRELEEELKRAGLSANTSVSAVAVMRRYFQREVGRPDAKKQREADNLSNVLAGLREARKNIA